MSSLEEIMSNQVESNQVEPDPSEEDGIDWDLVDIRLAVAENALEGKKRRDKLFRSLDANRNNQLSLLEAQAGLGSLLEADSSTYREKDAAASGIIRGFSDFQPAIKKAFNNAKRRSGIDGSTVDRTEFHALLVFFRHYVELLVLFKNLDDSGDMSLSEKEIMPAVPRLKRWGITENQVKSKLRTAPQGQLAFDDFADWCMAAKMQGFVFDEHEGEDMSQPSSPARTMTAGSKVNWAAVDERIPTVPGPEACAARDALFKKMDSVSNGNLSLSEVQASMGWLLEAGDGSQRKKGEAAETLIPCLKVKDMVPAVRSAFTAASVLASQPSNQKKKKTRKQGDDTVDRREFHALLVYLRYYLELQVLFQDLDTSQDLRVSQEECMKAMPLLTTWGIDEAAVKVKFSGSGGNNSNNTSHELKFPAFADWCLKIKLAGHKFDELEGDEPEEPEVTEAQKEEKRQREEKAKEIIEKDRLEREARFLEEQERAAIRIQAAARRKGAKKLMKEKEKELVNNQKNLHHYEDLKSMTATASSAGVFGRGSRTMAPSQMSRTLCSSYGSLPMSSGGVLKRPPHLTKLSHIRSLPKIKFGEKRAVGGIIALPPAGHETPAPGSYNLPEPAVTTKFRKQGADSFGSGGPRFGYEPNPVKRQPAPGEYGIPSNPAEKQQKVAFSKAPRRVPLQIRAADPGPGAYEVRSTLEARTCTAKGKLPVYYKPTAALPGAGTYNPRPPNCGILSHERIAPKAGFGTSTRIDLAERLRGPSPAPGAYELDTYHAIGRMGNKVSMKSKPKPPSCFDPYITPGPGTYDDAGTCFGY